MLTDARQDTGGQEPAQLSERPTDGGANTPATLPARPTVTMLCWCYHPAPGGGADRVMQQVAESLAARGWPVSVLTQRVKGTPRRERVNGVTVQRLWTLPMPGLRFLSYMLVAFWRQLFRADAGQVLHVNQFYLHVPLAVWLGRLRGLRVVVGVHGSGVAGDMQRLRRLPLGLGRLIWRAGRRADAIISLTGPMTTELSAVGIAPERIIQISNGVDCRRFLPASPDERRALRAQAGLPPDRPIVLFAGRLSAEKAVDVLLRAWQALSTRCPEALLLVAGDGPLRLEWETLARELGLAETVRFLGWTEAVLPLYQFADGFVLPSWSEGMPMALLEAMACGLPAVATAIPGTGDVMTHEQNGLLVKAGDEAALAASLARLLGDDKTLRARLGAAARQTIMARFSLEQMAEQYARLYQRLAQPAKEPPPAPHKEPHL